MPATATQLLPAPKPTSTPQPIRAFESGQYRNLLAELEGKSDAEIRQMIDRAWQQPFTGANDTLRVYVGSGNPQREVALL